MKYKWYKDWFIWTIIVLFGPPVAMIYLASMVMLYAVIRDVI